MTEMYQCQLGASAPHLGKTVLQQRGQPGSFFPSTHCHQDTSLQHLQHNSAVQPPGSNTFHQPPSHTSPSAYQPQPSEYPEDTKHPQGQALDPRYRHAPAPYKNGPPVQQYSNFNGSVAKDSFQRPHDSQDYMIKHRTHDGSHYGSSQGNTSLQRLPEDPIQRVPLDTSGPPSQYEHPPFQPALSLNDVPVTQRLQNGNEKRKSVRATQACNRCRDLKSKCDEQTPCSKCQENESECVYSVQAIRQDKQESILSKIDVNTENGLEILQIVKNIQKALKKMPDYHSSSPTGDDASGESENEKADNNEEDEEWKELPRAGSGIPESHTSSVSRIVSWKSVKNVVGDIDPYYAIIAEENRGVLQPYSLKNESEYALVKASHTFGGKIGAGGMYSILTNADSSISPPNNQQEIDGALKPGLESNTVDQLLDTYKRHINIKYPIFFDHELDSLAERFLKSKSAPFSISNDEIIKQRLKRKRSDDRVGVSVSTSTYSEVPLESVEHAIVLVILALGEASGHNQTVNDHQQGSSSDPVQSQSGYPSPEEIYHPLASSHSSAEKGVPQPLRTLAITPGLKYFTAATDIMGKHFGSNDLRYVQLIILASFYLGLLTQVSRCQAYLHEATRALRVISRSKSTRFRELAEEQKMGQEEDNPLLFAFWTCFQLESKIITELQLPQSGILSWAQHMPWPNGPAAIKAGMSKLQVESYMVGLMLRKHTNTVIADLYPPGREETYKLPLDPRVERQLYRSMEALGTSLAQFPRLASPETVDSTSFAMLRHQLDAEISFVQTLTYRPCLKMVMNRDILIDQVPAKVIHFAKLCIIAMQNGMKAFEGQESGPSVISDVWNIAHTQWGNASILQVAFRDELLKETIDAEKLMVHVRLTTKALRQVAQNSSALWQDHRLLELIGVGTGFL